jgi:hypothetical protein
MSDVILGAWHGGLGDSLQFSTLPEEFYKQQGRETYIWQDAPFRNQEIYDLVWGKNPYVKGKKQGERNAGDLAEYTNRDKTGDWIRDWESVHGLKPTNSLPKIYYEPEKVEGFEDTILVDFTSISIDHSSNKILDRLKEIKKEYSNKRFLEVTFSKSLSPDKFNSYGTNCENVVEIDDIFSYCDVIASSFGLVALSSGASHLSSSLKEYSPNLTSICLMEKEWYNRHVNKGNMFIFNNIDYQVV